MIYRATVVEVLTDLRVIVKIPAVGGDYLYGPFQTPGYYLKRDDKIVIASVGKVKADYIVIGVQSGDVTRLVPRWLFGEGEPDAELGQVGDVYLDTDTGDMYNKIYVPNIMGTPIATWVLVGTITIPALWSSIVGIPDVISDIATVVGADNDVLQKTAGVWTSRTPAQLKTSLALVKADVGLANVDNTSDATKNTAVATLTNKTLTAPAINNPTGIVAADISNFNTAADARIAAAVGVSVQARDGDLDDIAALTKTNDDFMQVKTGQWKARSIANVITDLLAGGLVDLTSVQTLTNKRMTPRSSAIASNTPIVPALASANRWKRTGMVANHSISAPTGSPTEGEVLQFRLRDNGISRTLTWNAAFRSINGTLPTSTTVNKWHYIDVEWNATDSFWDTLNVWVQP